VYRSAGSDQSRAPPTPPQRDRHRCPARRPRPRSDAPGPGDRLRVVGRCG